jgi:membrane fusion protein, multidrug efflux system
MPNYENRRQDQSSRMPSAAVIEEQTPAGAEREIATSDTDKETRKVSRAHRVFQEHPWKAILGLIVSAAVLLGTGYFIRNALLYESTDDAQVDGHIMPLSARITGYVLEVPVIRGQVVHAGDVLVTIDPQDYKIAVAQAQAALADALASAASSHWNVPITSVSVQSNLDSADSAVANAQAGVRAAEQNFQAAKAQLVQAEANAAKSDADLIRYEKLVAKEDVSRQQYDQAVATAAANGAAVESAKAVVQGAEQKIRQAEGRLLQVNADLRNAQTAPEQVSLTRAKALAADAQVEQRRSQVEQAELNLSYTVIRSPVTGIIGKKTVEVGQNVSIGQELVEVVPLDNVWVTANFKETQLVHMRPGQPVEIKLDAYGRTWKAHVTNMGGGTGSVFSLLPPENATGNYVKVVQRLPVRIDFDHSPGQDFNADGVLKPGLSVEPDVRVR